LWRFALVAPSGHFRLDPGAHVPTCQFNNEPVKNLARRNFDGLWSGEAA
jgi:hypothetical protein